MKKLPKTRKFWQNNYFLILALIPLALVIIFHQQQTPGFTISLMPSFFGGQAEALFDLWSVQHFLAGVLLGSLFLSSKKDKEEKWQTIIPFVIFLGILWEAVELILEFEGLSGYEHWTNKMITDPLFVLFGGIVGYIIKDSWRVAVVPMIVWLVLKIFLI